MKLIGMFDSPYVRRTLISARLLEVPVEHQPLSVFQHYTEFHGINPMVRAPTLVLDDGELLVDSGLILQHIERLAAPRSLYPATPEAHLRCLRLTSYALALADKAVQLYYEVVLRPQPYRWNEWITRLTAQLRDTCALLERQAEAGATGWLCGEAISQADITAAVAWRFTHHALPHILTKGDYPRLDALARQAEALPAFQATTYD